MAYTVLRYNTVSLEFKVYMLFEKLLLIFDNYHMSCSWFLSFLNDSFFMNAAFDIFFSKKLLFFESLFPNDILNFKVYLDSILLLLSMALSTSVLNSLYVSTKFLICIALLIFARGGIPRFRFDYLTKLGWIRFLSLVLLVFILEILIINIF